jgi:hypothetical protein
MFRLNIHVHWGRTNVLDRIDVHHAGIARKNHFIAGADP